MGALRLTVSSAAVLAAVAAGDALLPPLLACLSVGPAMAAGVAVWRALGAARSRLPGAAYRDELAFRDWQVGLGASGGSRTQRRWAERAVAMAAAPDWLLVLEGIDLPRRKRAWVRVELTLPSPALAPFRSRAAGRALIRSCKAACAAEGAQLSDRSLTADEVEDLLRSLEAFPDASRHVPPSGEAPVAGDGRLCDVLIARRSPFAVAQRRCGLAALVSGPQASSEALLWRLVQLAWVDENGVADDDAEAGAEAEAGAGAEAGTEAEAGAEAGVVVKFEHEGGKAGRKDQ